MGVTLVCVSKKRQSIEKETYRKINLIPVTVSQ